MVRDGRLELPTSCSQSKRATNCANPGFLVIQFCSRCGQTCGQSRFCAAFSSWGKTSKRPCCKALRRFAMTWPGYRHGTPKASALPTALIPDIQFLPLYHGGGENQRLFCLWSPAVKPACVSRKTISILLKSGAKSRPCAQKKFCTCRTIHLGPVNKKI